MARFERCDTSKIYCITGQESYLVKGTLTLDDVVKLNRLNRKVVLIFENTKGQNSEVIGGLDPSKVTISVMGGLNYFKKDKFNTPEYVERTIYTPKNLSNIIKKFESIERRINYSWTETQKCMFVYKTLAEKMHYNRKDEDEYENGLDICRSLNGMLVGRSVCSGFALIFKEAMDRLGIECHYQNMSHCHSWNVVKLDGEYRLLDLTWDVCKSKGDVCGFQNFCRRDSSSFYASRGHDLSCEREEVRFPAKSISDQVLIDNLKSINKSKNMYSGEMTKYVNPNGEVFHYLCISEREGFKTYVVRQGDNIDYFYIDKNADIRRTLDKQVLDSAIQNYNHNISRSPVPDNVIKFCKFTRADGSNFIMCKSKSNLDGGVNEYLYIEPYELDGKYILRKTTILSENELIVDDPDFKFYVANYLLNKERLARKVNHYNGYVGYIANGSRVYYNEQFEKEKLGIMNRKY